MEKYRKIKYSNTQDYSNTTGVYLNSLYKIPLINKGQEIQQAILMRYALYEMLEIAYKDPDTFTVFENLHERLLLGTVDCSDVVYVEDSSPEGNKGLSEKLIEVISSILTKHKKIMGLNKKLQKNPTDKKFKEQIIRYETDLLNLCHEVRFNNRWVRDILSFYKKRIKGISSWEDADEYNKWEEVYNNAKTKLVISNVRLVVALAKHFLNNGMELADLVQEGNKGLLIAVENFDYRKGYKLSTFSIWWIRQAILRALSEKVRLIRIPTNTLAMVNEIEKFINDYIRDNGVHPSIRIIAENLNKSEEKILSAYPYTLNLVHLDAEIDGETYIGDMVEDSTAENPLDRLSRESLREQIYSVLDNLKNNERGVIIMRFGLDDGRVKTLEEIGSILNLTSERIRQIALKALNKLKRNSYHTPLLSWKEEMDS